jgi:hypothetical protein
MNLDERVDDLGGFLRSITKIRGAWEPEDWKELWFRGEGHTHLEAKLRPALYRPLSGKALKSPTDLIEIEDDLHQYFQHNSTELAREESLADDSDDPWGSYFLMQHYGGPTRLLDWSDGALIALHFAIRDDQEPQCDRFVYVLDPYWLLGHLRDITNDHEHAQKYWKEFCEKYPSKGLDQDDWDQIYLPDEDGHEELPVPNLPLVLEFDHFARRISAQRSRFVVFGTAPDFFSDLLSKQDARLATITIAGGSIFDLRVQLRDAGITESVIYPSLDGLGRELRQLWFERLRK